MSDLFSESEIQRIREQALKDGFAAIACPRDGTLLSYQPQIFQAVGKDQRVRGVKMGDVRDVHSIAAKCPQCGCQADHISLIRL